jgi:hypothetical protein
MSEQSDRERQEIAIAQDYHAAFVGFKPGVNVLEHLVAKYYDSPIYIPGGADAQRETERRAAHREVVQHILQMMDKSQRGG